MPFLPKSGLSFCPVLIFTTAPILFSYFCHYSSRNIFAITLTLVAFALSPQSGSIQGHASGEQEFEVGSDAVAFSLSSDDDHDRGVCARGSCSPSTGGVSESSSNEEASDSEEAQRSHVCLIDLHEFLDEFLKVYLVQKFLLPVKSE